MLRLPRPQFKPLMYSTLMVDLCKLRRLFPRAMSACVRCGRGAGVGQVGMGMGQGTAGLAGLHMLPQGHPQCNCH